MFCCLFVALFVYISIIQKFVIFIFLFIYLISSMFYELDNVDIMFRLGGLPRIALLTTGHPGPFISICKK